MRELIAVRAWLVAVACAATACSVGDVAPVARYPWVEHARVALAEEHLTLVVGAEAIDVEASFRFEGEGDLPADLDFPIGAGGEVQSFDAVLVDERGARRTLAVDRAAVPPLPVDDAVEARRIFVGRHEIASKNRLIVRYRQKRAATFRYVLQSGAYWAGAIGALYVRVRDVDTAVAGVQVEGREADVTLEGERRWSFRDVEPHGGVVVQLK